MAALDLGDSTDRVFAYMLVLIAVSTAGLLYFIVTFVFGTLDKEAERLKKEEEAAAVKPKNGKYTRAEVSKHASRNDLWVVIRNKVRSQDHESPPAPRLSRRAANPLGGKQAGRAAAMVYDITSYVDEHPGGDAIMTNAGGDSTEKFFGPQHPQRVFDMIDDFEIGELVESSKDR